MKHENINSIVAVAGVLIALGSFYYDYLQDKKINNINYKAIATVNKPILKINGQPKIVSAEPYIPYNVENMMKKDKIKGNCDLGNEIPIRFDKLNLRINFKNYGNNTANIIAETTADKYEGNFHLRDILMGKVDNSQVDARPSTEFYHSNQIPSQEDKYINFISEAKNIKDNKLIRHIMILYKNDVDMLFDTYCWIKIDIGIKDNAALIDKHNFALAGTMRSGDIVVGKQYVVMDIADVKCDSKIYSEEEADTILQEIRRLCTNCTEDKKAN